MTSDDLDDVVQLEMNNTQYYGYGVMGFILSLIEAAIVITKEKIHPADIRCLLDQAKKMLSAEVEVYPGVESMLSNLSKDHCLMLITKGDLLQQQRKIKSSGLPQYFQAMEIVSDKTTAVFLEIMSPYNTQPDRFVMVGNSMRSDIQPVLELGGWAIHELVT